MTSSVKVLHDRIETLARRMGLQAAAYALARGGKLLATGQFGCDAAATFTIMSPSKTLQNAALWPLIADGRLRLDACVADYVPEFATNGKSAVTVEQVMLHTSCFANQPMDFARCAGPAYRREAYAAWVLEGVPGVDYAYHPGNGAWVLADVAEAASGVAYRELFNTGLLARAGLYGPDALALGLPPQEQAAIRPVAMVLTDAQTAAMPPFRSDPATGLSPMLQRLNPPAARAIGLPGSGVTGTAAALTLIYQAFLDDPQGLWDPDVRLDATRAVRLKTRGRWDLPIQRSLGFYVAGPVADRLGETAFFGSGVSETAFGHEGQGGQMVWADPATGLSFAFLTDTVTFTPIEQVSWPGEISTAAAALAATFEASEAGRAPTG